MAGFGLLVTSMRKKLLPKVSTGKRTQLATKRNLSPLLLLYELPHPATNLIDFPFCY